MLIASIRQLAANGHSIASIAKLTGTSYSKVYRLARENGINANDGRHEKRSFESARKIAAVDEPQVIAKYQAGASLAQLGHEYNTTAATILALLRRHNIPRRLKNGRSELTPPKVEESVLRDWYQQQGRSLSDIAKEFGYPNSAGVQRDMDWYGIPRRGYSAAGKIKYQTTPSHRQRIAENLRRLSDEWRYGKRTWIEAWCEEWLQTNQLEYEYQYRLPADVSNTQHLFDFWIKGTQILIEMDGEFWHSPPQVRAKDKWYTEEAAKVGYTVIRITDTELKTHGKGVFDDRLGHLI